MDEELRRPAQILLCAFVFVLLALYNLLVASRQMPPTGDEPHYLVVAHSLAYDGDLSLLNNYQEKHYRAFYPGELPKRTTPSADGSRELPAEGLGLAFLLAPFYRFAREVLPASWTVPFLRIVACSITVVVLYLLLSCLHAAAAPSRAWLYAAFAFLCSPLLFYSGQFYPEMPAALCIAAALLSWIELEEHPERSLWILSLLPGALVWLHPKYVALAIVLLALSAWHIRRTFRIYHEWKTGVRIALLLSVGIAGILSFFIFLRAEYGGWSPNRIYAGWEPQQQKTLVELIVQEGFGRIRTMVRMLFGFWFDQRFGLLIFAPFYIAFFPAMLGFFPHKKDISRSPAPSSLPFTFFRCAGAPHWEALRRRPVTWWSSYRCCCFRSCSWTNCGIGAARRNPFAVRIVGSHQRAHDDALPAVVYKPDMA